MFLTGDLGFNALEPVAEAFGDRFINAGVAEQNMVGVAAGLARAGMRPFVYSIAPFAVFRPFEQIRNDICLHNLPVTLIGNGGGFGYGVMGPTHHALEDYGVLGTLPNMLSLVPAFDEDVPACLERAARRSGPAYLRLGYDRGPKTPERPLPYAPWRCLIEGTRDGPTVAVTGAIAGLVWSWCQEMNIAGLSLWVASELPVAKAPPPEALAGAPLVVVEEHVRNGGFGESLVAHLAEAGRLTGSSPRILAVPQERASSYGDQIYNLEKNGIGRAEFADLLSP